MLGVADADVAGAPHQGTNARQSRERDGDGVGLAVRGGHACDILSEAAHRSWRQ